MKPRILITVQGGNIVNVSSNTNIDVVIVDYDKDESERVTDIQGADNVVNKFWPQIDGKTKEEEQVKTKLKNLNY